MTRFNVFVLCVIAVGFPLGPPAAAQNMSSVSCNGQACHANSFAERGFEWNTSLQVWFKHDPHSKAGQVLDGELSRRMIRHLLATNDESVSGSEEVAKSEQTGNRFSAAEAKVVRERCLGCHTSATTSDCANVVDLDPLIVEGVSCGSCHGPADDWLDPHTREDWVKKDKKRFVDTAMRDTEGHVERAKTCVRCHVGSRTEDGVLRDMNHDLIAAGHPALRFDLLEYLQRYQRDNPRPGKGDWIPHWSFEAEEKFLESKLKVRQVGRAVGLAAAAKLSAERAWDAKARDPNVPWPEFADFDCFACHRTLNPDAFRLTKNASVEHVSGGLPKWNPWYSIDQYEFVTDTFVRQTEDEMIEKTDGIADVYLDSARRLVKESAEPEKALDDILQKIVVTPVKDWYTAEIQYRDIEAALLDYHDTAPLSPVDVEILKPVEKLLKLSGPVGDGPDAAGIQFNSPAHFNAARFRDAIRNVRTEILKARN